MVAVRLSDVTPEGAATRVSYGLLNLTHRNGHERPEPLQPGKRYSVTVPLKHVAQRFARGHRIRLSVSTGYFPVAWPTPEPVTLTVHPAECRLVLPLRKSVDVDEPASFGPAEGAAALEIEPVEPARKGWTVKKDLADGSVRVEIGEGTGTFRIAENDLTITSDGTERYSFRGDDLDSVKGEVTWIFEMARENWNVRSVTETSMTSTPTHFHVEAHLKGWEGDRLVHEQRWSEDIPRQLV
jgi:hypothetical protein